MKSGSRKDRVSKTGMIQNFAEISSLVASLLREEVAYVHCPKMEVDCYLMHDEHLEVSHTEVAYVSRKWMNVAWLESCGWMIRQVDSNLLRHAPLLHPALQSSAQGLMQELEAEKGYLPYIDRCGVSLLAPVER